ncbi:uncharacterized protein LOC144692781 isoform X1 [Cetorhinus maximus]
MTEFPLLMGRHSSSTTGSCRYKRSSKPLQVAVINIDRIPVPTANLIRKESGYSVAQTTNTHYDLVKEQRFPTSRSLPSNPPSMRVNSKTNSASISSNLHKAVQVKINHLVSSSFKQSTVSHMCHVHCFSPGEELKFEILNEIEQIKKLQSDQRPVCCRHVVNGQLLKARLKPLYPVVVEGPSIIQCRGILPEISNCRSHPGRGLRFHEQLVNYLSYDDCVRETPDTLHHTSICSLKDEEISET